jgi:hypothetical protein
MSEYEGPEAARSQLRATVARLSTEIDRLPPSANAEPGHDVRALFADLVEQLALGAEPETRICPVCKQVCARMATLCSHCWTKLSPP